MLSLSLQLIFFQAAKGKFGSPNDTDTKPSSEAANDADTGNERKLDCPNGDGAVEKEDDKSEESKTSEEEEEEKLVKEESSSAESANAKPTGTATMADQANRFLFEFPSPYAHELCTLRQNVVDSFVA